MKKMAIIGCGNMASALCLGAPNKKEIEFYTYTPSKTRAVELAKGINGVAIEKLDSIPECDYYLIGCKPQQFEKLSNELKGKLPNGSQVISMMASKSIEVIKKGLEHDDCLRVMPNLSVASGNGINLIFSNKNLDSTLLAFFSSGLIYQCKSEIELDDLMLLSGCGPGILGEILSQLSDAYQQVIGLEQKSSKEMILKLLEGLIIDLKQENMSEYVRRVCSPGGVTEQSVMTFRDKKLLDIFKLGLERSRRQNNQLK